jgi:hypothetical protein
MFMQSCQDQDHLTLNFKHVQDSILNDRNISKWYNFYLKNDPTLSGAMAGSETCSVEVSARDALSDSN